MLIILRFRSGCFVFTPRDRLIKKYNLAPIVSMSATMRVHEPTTYPARAIELIKWKLRMPEEELDRVLATL